MKKNAQHNRVLMLVENKGFPDDFRVRREATALVEAGYIVSLICPSNPGLPLHEAWHGICIYRYPAPAPGRSSLTYLWEYGYSLLSMFLLSIIVLIKPGFDFIHAANPPDTAVLLALVYKPLGKRFIFDHHDLSPELYQLKFGAMSKLQRLLHRTLIFLERLSCRLADRVIATNSSYRDIEIQRDGVPTERITVVRNGPDLDPKSNLHSIGGMHPYGKKSLLYLGVIGSQDGVDYLLRALHHLKCTLGKSDFICTIAGDGDALPSLKQQALEMGLIDDILFPGWIESSYIASYVNSADICLAPEPSNPLNDRSTIVKIMDYMALAKPIVAFDLPEHRKTAGGAIFYATPNDELDFARKIAALMDDEEACRNMGQVGIDRVKNELSWSHQKLHLLEAYAKLGSTYLASHRTFSRS